MQTIRGWKEGVPGRSVSASKLERWLGAEELEQISKSMEHWHGPPIALYGVPGNVFVHKGGDFRGELRADGEATAMDYVHDFYKRIDRNISRAAKKFQTEMYTGFPDLATLISRGKYGHAQTLKYWKDYSTTSFSPGVYNMWRIANGSPAAGSVTNSAPFGSINSKSTTGAMRFNDARTGEQLFLAEIRCWDANGANGRTVVLFDRLFGVAKTMSSSALETVSTTPIRYQNTTVGAIDWIGGNFVSAFVGANPLTGSTAHTWTVTYTNEADEVSRTATGTGGVSNLSQFMCDGNVLQSDWFYRLQDPDRGVKNITDLQCSTNLTGGSMDFIIGHPLALFASYVSTHAVAFSFINSGFNLVPVMNDACLDIIETRGNTTVARLDLQITLVGG
jgi:hypothetical protein